VRYIVYLGFALPADIVLPPDQGGGGPRDRHPAPGKCDRCGRERSRNWRSFSGARMCAICLEDAVRVKTKGRRWANYRGIFRGEALPQPNREALSPDDREKPRPFDRIFWSRSIT
jgi:hypothetical protein